MASYQKIITDARELLQDTNAETGLRFTDSFLVNQLNRGIEELGRIRPDAFSSVFDKNSLNIPEVIAEGDPTDEQVLWTEETLFEGQFFTPLVFYVTGSSEVTDDEFTMDGRAGLLLGQFRQTVLGI